MKPTPTHGPLAGSSNRVVPIRSRGHDRASEEARLQTALRAAVASDGAGVGIMVTRGCGTVEVRVFGPAAALTLSFDHAEAQIASVRPAIRAAMSRYGSALGHQTADPEKE